MIIYFIVKFYKDFITKIREGVFSFNLVRRLEKLPNPGVNYMLLFTRFKFKVTFEIWSVYTLTYVKQFFFSEN